MAEPTYVECIDNIVSQIEKASEIELRWDNSKSKDDKIEVKEPRRNYVICRFDYEVFIYTNGKGKEAQIAIYREHDVKNRCDYCEMCLLDVPDANDPRVREYVRVNQGGIDYIMDLKFETEEDAIKNWKEGKIYASLELAAKNKSPCLIHFKQGGSVSFEHISSWDRPANVARNGLIITGVGDVMRENLGKFIKYLMTSNAR